MAVSLEERIKVLEAIVMPRSRSPQTPDDWANYRVALTQVQKMETELIRKRFRVTFTTYTGSTFEIAATKLQLERWITETQAILSNDKTED